MAKRDRRGRWIPQTESIASNDIFIPNHDGIKDFVETTMTIFKKVTTRLTTTTQLTDQMEEVFCNTDTSGYTVTLPVGTGGERYRIINSGTSGNSLTVTPSGTQDLLGSNSSFSLMDKETLIVVFEPTEGWF